MAVIAGLVEAKEVENELICVMTSSNTFHNSHNFFLLPLFSSKKRTNQINLKKNNFNANGIHLSP